MKFNKRVMFFNNGINQLKSNKMRFFLTVSGVCIASILLLFANILLETYMQSLYEQAYKCSNDGIIISGSINKRMWEDMNIKFAKKEKTIFYPAIYSDTEIYSSKDIKLNIMPIIIGTSTNFLRNPMYSVQNENSLFKSKIVKGRDLRKDDVIKKNRVVIISEQSEKILFGGKSAIGKVLKLSMDDENREDFTIVGVYLNSSDEEKNEEKINNAIKKKNESINVLINCYIPYTVYKDYDTLKSSSIDKVVMNVKKTTEKWYINNYYSLMDSVNIVFREKNIKQIDDINEETKVIIDIIKIIMIIIAGLNLFNSIMFSIQERVGEIGIRKAIGAKDSDIVKQFIYEGILISLLGGIFSIVIVTILVGVCQLLILNYSTYNIKIEYELGSLLEVMVYDIIMGIIFSIVPSLKAARTNVIDAIRFD